MLWLSDIFITYWQISERKLITLVHMMKNGYKLEKILTCKKNFSYLHRESRLTSVTLVTPSTVIILGLKTSFLRAV